jgi:DNA-binding NtrC family response regulator
MQKLNSSLSAKSVLIVEDQFIEAHDLQLILERASYHVCGIARSYDEALKILETESPELVLLDIMLKGKLTGIDLAKVLLEKNIGFIFISANSSSKILDQAKTTQPYGFIVKPFREQDVLITLEIAFYRHNYSQESQIQQQFHIQKDLSTVFYDCNNHVNYFINLVKVLQTYIPFDYFEAGFIEEKKYDILGLLRTKMGDYQVIDIQNLSDITKVSVDVIQNYYNESPKETKSSLYMYDNFQKNYNSSPIKRLIIQNFGLKSFLFCLLLINDRPYGLSFYSRQPDIQNVGHLTLLQNLEFILSSFIGKISNEQNIQAPNKTEYNTHKVLIDDSALDGIIGSSEKILQVFDRIKKVGPSDTSVLVLGESGTGKELIAESIHKISKRRDKPFIVIDCSTLPQNLAESLLFGHEKGAFTGANERRIGKFELATGGTIFLDEIGELPIELQVKLLRVLQQREIERVGGSCKINVDVRIIAATNRHLEEEVAAGRFRMDLYYRLYVFPVTIPPLRERKEDIPELINHFIEIYGKSLNKQNAFFSKKALAQLMNYNWEGNIRELEHVVQRSLLLSNDHTEIATADLPTKNDTTNKGPEEYAIKTINENERDYIIYILQKCKGKISGANGAAEILDIHPSTLNSRIKKLGIKMHLFS